MRSKRMPLQRSSATKAGLQVLQDIITGSRTHTQMPCKHDSCKLGPDTSQKGQGSQQLQTWFRSQALLQ